MGIFTSLLNLLGCRRGNKPSSQNTDWTSFTPIAAQITMDDLPEVLRNVQAGQTEFDFMGICTKEVDCIYFMQENEKFYIDYEANCKAQLPYLDILKQFAKEHNYPIVETTYGVAPIDYDHMKAAPVLSLKVNTDIDSIVEVGKLIEQTIFHNNDETIYDTVP